MRVIQRPTIGILDWKLIFLFWGDGGQFLGEFFWDFFGKKNLEMIQRGKIVLLNFFLRGGILEQFGAILGKIFFKLCTRNHQDTPPPKNNNFNFQSRRTIVCHSTFNFQSKVPKIAPKCPKIASKSLKISP